MRQFSRILPTLTGLGYWVLAAGLVVVVACVPTVESSRSEAGANDLRETPVAAADVQQPVAPAIEISPACDDAFRAAASVSDMRDTVEDLDPAVRACRSVEEWNAAARRHPGALDGADSEYFLWNRCRSFGEPSGAICEEVRGKFGESGQRLP